MSRLLGLSLILFLLVCSSRAASEKWQILISPESRHDVAIGVALHELIEEGKNFNLEFHVTSGTLRGKNTICVCAASNPQIIELIRQSGLKFQTLENPEAFEIKTIEKTGQKIVILSGASLPGEVYGLYWILDRLRVWKEIPVLNELRAPTFPVRYTRYQVTDKASINRALRYGLNMVYGRTPLALVPWKAEPEATENAQNRAREQELIVYAHQLRLKYLAFGTDFTFHPEIIQEFGATLSPGDPAFWDAVQAKYRRLFLALPELDGVVVFTGEEQNYWGNYHYFDPIHGDENCDWSLAKRYRTFVKKVQSVVSGEFNKIYHHRTWITNCFEQQARPEVYRAIFTPDVPTENLFLIPSFTQNDRWWYQRYNPTFNQTPHQMLAVLEPMNYYESSKSNLFPTFPGQYYQAGLQWILETENSNLKGCSFDLPGLSAAFPKDDFRTASLTAYTGFRLQWDYRTDPAQIAEDFCAIHFGREAALQMAEIYLLSATAYKYGLFIEPVAYGEFNSMPHLRVGEFTVQGYPSIDHGTAHLEFWRQIYRNCQPWLEKIYLDLDYGLSIAAEMREKFQTVQAKIDDRNLAIAVDNSLKMTYALIETNNYYVKTALALFAFRENPTEINRQKLAVSFEKLAVAAENFRQVPGFGYQLFGVDQILLNTSEVLDDLAKAEQTWKSAPNSAKIEQVIAVQQQKYRQILENRGGDAIKCLYWEGRVDGRDILKIREGKIEVEHLQWDPIYFQNFKFFTPLPRRPVSVVVRDLESNPIHPFVMEQPTPENDFTAKIYLYDVPGGAGWVKLELYFLENKPVELDLG
jgi:hypothetical protein